MNATDRPTVRSLRHELFRMNLPEADSLRHSLFTIEEQDATASSDDLHAFIRVRNLWLAKQAQAA